MPRELQLSTNTGKHQRMEKTERVEIHFGESFCFKKACLLCLKPYNLPYDLPFCLVNLKCYYDQILDIHFFTFSHTIGVSKIFCQISIYYEQQNSCFLDLYFREFTAAINFPCSKSGLRIGENDIIFSKIPHGNGGRKFSEIKVQKT